LAGAVDDTLQTFGVKDTVHGVTDPVLGPDTLVGGTVNGVLGALGGKR
jgi:hypothetical protein